METNRATPYAWVLISHNVCFVECEWSHAIYVGVISHNVCFCARATPRKKYWSRKSEVVMLTFGRKQTLPCLLILTLVSLLPSLAGESRELPSLSYDVLESSVWKWYAMIEFSLILKYHFHFSACNTIVIAEIIRLSLNWRASQNY